MDDPVQISHEDKERREREQEEQRQKAEAELLEGSADIIERRTVLRYQVIEPGRKALKGI